MEILLAIVIVGLLIAGMAIGVIMGRKPISGSCGGVGKALGEENYQCDICGGDPQKCDEQTDTFSSNRETGPSGYDAASQARKVQKANSRN